MLNKKTPDGNQELEPIWTDSKIASHAAQLYDTYRKIFEEDQAKGIETFLMDFCLMQGRLHQLEEAYVINRKVSSGAADVSHKAVQKYQQFEATLKTQGQNFSKRLEELEHNGF
ncbi:MAG: hypothetical protein JJ843_00950 [Prochlorococcus marinus CUG1434]|nr:hypothetical protein [Prochlorococcus marinus CUG1434]